MKRITLYGRTGCHLCDEARTAIRELVAADPDVTIDEVDIESDDRLVAAYLERIPVVEVDGREVSELEFDHHAFKRAMHTVSP